MNFADVKTYFQANCSRFADLAWDDPHQLGPDTLRAVRGSLQRFQRGQGTGSDHLQALAEQLGDADYAAALRLFSQEEKGHAEMLGRFMDKQGIAQLKIHWLQAVFRKLKRSLGLAHTVHLILTAEVVATVYYRALFNATYSGLLQQLCRRISLDKEMHLAFHCLAIRQLVPTPNRLTAWLWQQNYRGLLAGTALLAYVANRRTLRAGGYRLGTFCAAVVAEYARAERMQQPDGLIALRGGLPAPPLAVAGPAGAWQWPGQQLRAVR